MIRACSQLRTVGLNRSKISFSSVCLSVWPAAMSMEQRVGEPRLAARWSGVFPPNVTPLTSAFNCKQRKQTLTLKVLMCVGVQLCVKEDFNPTIRKQSQMSSQSTSDTFTITDPTSSFMIEINEIITRKHHQNVRIWEAGSTKCWKRT